MGSKMGRLYESRPILFTGSAVYILFDLQFMRAGITLRSFSSLSQIPPQARTPR